MFRRLQHPVVEAALRATLDAGPHGMCRFCALLHDWRHAYAAQGRRAGERQHNRICQALHNNNLALFLKKSPALKALLVVLIGVAAITLFVGKRWYDYVSKAKSPYEEIGIELNSRAPGPLNRWGCAQLQERFAKSVPPYGCAAGDGRQWK